MSDKYVVAKVFESPLPGIEPRHVNAEIGSPVRDIVSGCRVPMVCLIDGVPMKREWWMKRPVCEGDSIEFHPIYLGGGGGSRSILGAIAMIVLTIYAPYLVAAINPAWVTAAGALTNIGRVVAAGIVMIGSALISAVIMPSGGSSANGQGDKPSSIYDVDTQGNQAKIFSPVPVQYGRMKAFPDYAAQPYVRYYTSEDVLHQIQLKGGASQGSQQQQVTVPLGSSVSDDGDQYYFALFCLGQGEYEVESITIADADISGFADVLVADILLPGQMPRYVNPCVVTSEAVSGQSLDNAEYVGGFPTCGPGRRTSKIALDFIFPQGLCKVDDKGKAKAAGVNIIVDIAPYSDASLLSGPWQNVFSGTYNGASMTPQRRTLELPVPKGRYMVRVRRSDKKDKEDNRDLTSCVWQALRAELDEAAPLCKTATHFELVMRASEQLSSLSQRKIAIICTRKVRDWNGTLVPSRSPMLALKDKWQNDVYGDGLPDDRIDFDTLKRLDALCAQRQDRFDYRFESRVTSREADQLIASAVRSVVLQRQGVKTVVRDGLELLPITLFNATNTVEGSVSIDYIQVTEETADGVIGEFFNHNIWGWDEIECPAPGFSASNPNNPYYDPSLPQMKNPLRVRFEGITGRMHAFREGIYLAYTNALRRQFVTWSTELQGALVYYGAPLMFSSTLYNSSGGGEVMDYRDSDGAFRLTGDVSSTSRIVFMFPNGSVTEPQELTALGDGWIRVHGPGVPVSFGDYSQERTRYALLDGEITRHMVKLTGVYPRGMGDTGAPKYELKGVVDVPEVHTADERLLPAPGEEQDLPVPVTPDTPGGALITLGQFQGGINIYTRAAQWPSSGYPASIVFYPDGRLMMRYYNGGFIEASSCESPPYTYTIPKYWVSVPQQNIGTEFEIALILSFGWREEEEVRQLERYMWLQQSPPADNLIMQGKKMYRVTGDESDTSTKTLISLRAPTTWPLSPSYITDWIPLTDAVEFRSFWRGMAPYTETGVLKELNLYQISGAIAIREKASKSFQAASSFAMGIYNLPDDPGGSITI